MKTIAQLKAEGYNITTDASNYESIEDTINASQIEDVPFGELQQANSIEINNDTAGKDLIVRLNGKTKNITIKGEESRTIPNMIITSMTLYNNSGSTISYRIYLWGIE